MLDNLRRLWVQDAVIDGEIVYVDAAGKSQFIPLLRRRSPQQFVAFYLLWLNGATLPANCFGGCDASGDISLMKKVICALEQHYYHGPLELFCCRRSRSDFPGTPFRANLGIDD